MVPAVAGGPTVVRVEPVMGTVASLHVLPGPLGPAEVQEALERTCRLLHHVDDVFSTWKPESPMSLLRAGRLTPAEVPPEIPLVLDLCAEARRQTRGWFDPWAMPGGVDPTGLVKGWAGREALQLLREAGADAAMVNLGGDIAVFGSPAGGGRWRVGIRHPWRPEGLACVVEVEAAIATSGRYERGDHLVDPTRAGASLAAASATVTGPDLAFADAYATALAVAGAEGLGFLAELPGYEGYVIGADGAEATTPAFAVADPLTSRTS